MPNPYSPQENSLFFVEQTGKPVIENAAIYKFKMTAIFPRVL
jgi:hypothetical protein